MTIYKTLFDDLLWVIEKSLQMIGLDEIHNMRAKRSTFYLAFQRILYAFGTFQLPLLMIGEIILISNIINEGKITNEKLLLIAEVSPCLFICSFCLMKSSRLVIQRNRIIDVLEEFRHMWPVTEDMNEETKVVVDRHMVWTKWISIIYSLCTHILSYVYNLSPIGVMIYNKVRYGQTDLILPYLVWYPYDNSKNFWIWTSSYISHFYAGVFVCGGIASADCLFGFMTSNLSMHIELLAKQIQKIPLEDGSKYSSREKLEKVIIQHNKLVGLCNRVGVIFSPLLLFTLLASSGMICILLFSVTIAPFVLIIKYSFFIGSAMAQVLIMSWYGHQLLSTSNKLGYAAYSSKWTDMDGPDSIHVKKSLVLLMARASHPMCVSAYGFTVISMKTFSLILKASWSYFSLLRAVYQKSE